MNKKTKIYTNALLPFALVLFLVGWFFCCFGSRKIKTRILDESPEKESKGIHFEVLPIQKQLNVSLN